jgi:hypothetical protein
MEKSLSMVVSQKKLLRRSSAQDHHAQIGLLAAQMSTKDKTPALTSFFTSLLEDKPLLMPLHTAPLPKFSLDKASFKRVLQLDGLSSRNHRITIRDFFKICAAREAMNNGVVSEDPILQNLHFENNNREHDPTTIKLGEGWEIVRAGLDLSLEETALKCALFFMAARLCGGIYIQGYLVIENWSTAEGYCDSVCEAVSRTWTEGLPVGHLAHYPCHEYYCKCKEAWHLSAPQHVVANLTGMEHSGASDEDLQWARKALVSKQGLDMMLNYAKDKISPLLKSLWTKSKSVVAIALASAVWEDICILMQSITGVKVFLSRELTADWHGREPFRSQLPADIDRYSPMTEGFQDCMDHVEWVGAQTDAEQPPKKICLSAMAHMQRAVSDGVWTSACNDAGIDPTWQPTPHNLNTMGCLVNKYVRARRYLVAAFHDEPAPDDCTHYTRRRRSALRQQ